MSTDAFGNSPAMTQEEMLAAGYVRLVTVIAKDGLTDIEAIVTPAGVIHAYENSVRADRCDSWDTIHNVATCNDGVYGAWGEVLDAASDLGLPPADDSEDADYVGQDELYRLFKELQEKFRKELETRP